MNAIEAVSAAGLPVELYAASAAECEEFLHEVLDEALTVTTGDRGFIALVDIDRGELELRFTAGPGWTEETRRFRLNIGDVNPDDWTQRRGITSYVVATGEPYWSGDVAQDPHYIKFFDDVKSEIAVPIRDPRSRRAIGVINIDSGKADAFSEQDCLRLSRLAQRGAIALTMLEHQAREGALIIVGQELSATANVTQVMQTVVAKARALLRADDCSLFLLDELAGTLTLSASHGLLAKFVGKKQYRLGEGLTGWIAENDESICVADPRQDSRWLGKITEFPPEDLGAFLGTPIRGRDRAIGVLRVVRKRKGSLAFIPQEFSDADAEIFRTIASQLGVTLDKARLVDRLLHAERMAAWGEMSARSAHMLGNALFGVKGDLNELKHLLPASSEEVRQVVGDLERGLGRVEHILEEFRDFVRATQLEVSENDLNQMVREAAQETLPRRSPLELRLQLAEGLPAITADASKLKRALSELIENSIDFQPDGGVIRLATSLVTAAELDRSIIAPRARQYVRLVCEDRGPGLTADDKQRVFSPFFTRKAKGLGLGMSIVKGIIDAHGGNIRETGVAGNGARFEILLPAKEKDSI